MDNIVIIDYGMGNLRSAQKSFERVGYAAQLSSDPADIARADKLVLPGVGAFRDCIGNLRAGGFVAPLKAHVAAGKPLLGICVGLQLLFTESEEFGRHQGLGIIPGRVVRFPAGMQRDGEELKVPHMGWNDLQIRRPAPIFQGIEDGSFVYFVHSYYAIPDDPALVAAEATYGEITFCAAVWQGNVMATQFHPEKSQGVGLEIVRNFAAM
ncbi:imidazole glycerol phosphate synthase subunit HisH [Desulfuromonas carbonis]|uniref:imidazole glycerol phosphate synthase subunit HisH n=1 Tax=Desulfuromonas sp. DDH964 TaxID=1823759 RepID=UPI00078D99BF|nr:imidazole glycerol phosphate synthase subunit HisH [Desulfuromonas sp. DDH964]AMV73569.1 imidazole glycerol phosphate synthase subunit HisH [Desulfuromonas sp. DDH964]